MRKFRGSVDDSRVGDLRRVSERIDVTRDPAKLAVAPTVGFRRAGASYRTLALLQSEAHSSVRYSKVK